MQTRHCIRCVLAAAISSVDVNAQSARSAPLDSLILERTLCYGTCPAYRLHITAAGSVFFRSLNPGDSSRTARDQISADSWRQLSTLVDRAALPSLPDDVRKDQRLCPDEATDHPAAIVTVFRGQTRVTVRDYYGCYAAVDHSPVGALLNLRQLEATVDRVTQVQRWTPPARVRP